MPVRTPFEVEEDLKKEYTTKLRVNDRTIHDSFKTPHRWLEEDGSMAFWLMLLYPYIFNYSMFYRVRFGSTDLSDYKNSKTHDYYKSGWLQLLCFYKIPQNKY